MSLQRRYLSVYVNFPYHFSSAVPEFSAPSGAGGTPWGPGAASAESCTHPAKRGRCFLPPIAERQRIAKCGNCSSSGLIIGLGGIIAELA